MAVKGRLLPAECLDVRDRETATAHPTKASANIPVDRLTASVYELPPTSECLNLADTGVEAGIAREELNLLGRKCRLTQPIFADPGPDRYRLWHVPSVLAFRENPAPGRALCLACGVGREAVALAAEGWDVTAIDILPDAIERGRLLERAYAPEGSAPIQWLTHDLRRPLPELIRNFDLVVQLFYSSDLTPDIVRGALAPGGLAILEAFSATHWENLGRPRPRSLTRLDWSRLVIVREEEGMHDGRHSTRMVLRPEA